MARYIVEVNRPAEIIEVINLNIEAQDEGHARLIAMDMLADGYDGYDYMPEYGDVVDIEPTGVFGPVEIVNTYKVEETG